MRTKQITILIHAREDYIKELAEHGLHVLE